MSDIKNFERNKYFYGKLMTVRDFETEQSYFIEKQRLINRLIHGAGVVCGLKVEKAGDWLGTTKIKIKPGVAIDCCGRDIIVPEEKVVDLKEEYSLEGTDKVYVLLKYDYCEKESVPVINNVSACEETCCYNRILETYKIEISEEMPDDCTLADEELCEVWSNAGNPENFVEYWIDKGCPECPQEPAVLLAAISLQNSTINEIDNAIIKDEEGFEKSLIFSNAHLYELIKCVEKKAGLEKDLPCIAGISWEHDREYDLSNPSDMEELRELMRRCTITFNKDIKKETINHKTLNGILLEYIFVEDYNDCGYVEQTSAKSNLPVCFFPEEAKDRVSFTFFPGISGIGNVGYWAVNNMIKTRIKTAYKSRVTMGITTGEVKVQNVGMRILIQLKGDFVLDDARNPVDANHLKGEPPTGNGTPGGLFESWFDVKLDYSMVANAKKVISNKPAGSTTEEVETSASLSSETAYFILEAMAKNNLIYYKEGKYYPLPDPAKTMIVYDAKYNYMRRSAKELKDNLGDEGIIAKIKSSDELTEEDKINYEIISLRGRDITETTKRKMRGIESKLNWSKSTGDTEIVKSPYIEGTNVFIVGGKNRIAVDVAVDGFLKNYMGE